MNDRYLYRAKRCDTGEWVEGNCINDGVTGQVFIHASGNSVNESDKVGEDGCLRFVAFEVDPSTICQCTGLKDKKGKLIWENDIMVAHLDDSFPEDTTYERAVWNNNGFCTKEQGSEDISPLDKFDQEYFEVCGNIFDNPELLEVGCGQELDCGETDYIHG